MNIADILTDIRDTCEGTSSTTLLDNTTLLRRINIAYETVVSLIIRLDGKWQFDDANFTDFPIATTDLVDGQEDFTFDVSVLDVEGISILDNQGRFQKLNPIDVISESGIDPSERYQDNGRPLEYDKQGSSINLYPTVAAADVTLTGGLKVFFKRTADLYTSAQLTTGTKVPGFASPFHIIISRLASLPYCVAYKPKIVPFLQNEITEIMGDSKRGITGKLAKHYGQREQDRRKIISMGVINNR